jgi:prolyl oligopeptidase
MRSSLILQYIVGRLEEFVLFCAIILFIYNILDAEIQQDIFVLVTGQEKKSKKSGRYPELPSNVEKDQRVKICEKDVLDPFTCLEHIQREVTQQWLESQYQCTVDYLNTQVSDIKENFIKEYKEAMAFELPDNPVNHGGMYFFFKKLHQELPQFTLFATPNLHFEAKPVFDPNTLREPIFVEIGSTSSPYRDKDPLSSMLIVHGVWISSDGYKLAYGYTSSTHSNLMSIGVRDLKTNNDSAIDIIRNCYVDYSSVSWVDSRSGFFYTTQQPFLDQNDIYSNRVYFHKLGTKQSMDVLIFETESGIDQLMINTQITSDGHYLLLELFQKRREITNNSLWRSVINENCSPSAVGNKVYYYDLCKFDGLTAESLGSCVKLIDSFEYLFSFVSNVEDDCWFRSNYMAPNFRVVRITLPTDLNSHEGDVTTEACRNKLLNAWKFCLDWIPQRTDGDYLVSAGIAAHTVLVLKYLKDAGHEVLLYDLTQYLVEESQIAVASLPHPSYGTIIGPSCNFYSAEIFYQFSSYADPSSVYRALIERDPFSGAISISFHEVNSTSIPNTDKYLYDSQQVYVETMRNVSVPLLMFGLSETLGDLRQPGDPPQPKPCILMVSGGFGVSITPVFSLPLLLFVKHCRGVILVANLQGSGIYGSSWKHNGLKELKENAVTDLHCLIKYAIGKGLTTPSQLCLLGGTYNGTLIGTALTRFPTLFSAAVIEDGIFDLLRYPSFNPPFIRDKVHPDDKHVVDSSWYQEFGYANDSDEELMRLSNLSPLHNVNVNFRLASYPAVLLMAGK